MRVRVTLTNDYGGLSDSAAKLLHGERLGKVVSYVGELLSFDGLARLTVDVREVYHDDELAVTWHVPNVQRIEPHRVRSVDELPEGEMTP